MTSNTASNVEQQEISFIAVENTKWYSHSGRQAVSYKIKHTLTIRMTQ